ncbi:putative serine incorporator, partial [Acropora cervicornis]
MGAALQTLGLAEVASEVACCAGSAAFSLLCKNKVAGIRSRLYFTVFLLLGTILCLVMLAPNMRTNLDKIPLLCTKLASKRVCDNVVGYGAVYRVSFAMATFFLLFSLLTYNVHSKKQFRARIHNGFWYIKLSLLVLIIGVAFYLPNLGFLTKVWMYVGLTGGFMFILIQIILVVDFGHSWSVSWAEKMDTLDTKCWYFSLAFSTAFVYSLSVTAAVMFYLFFTNPDDISQCQANTFYISFNVGHCALATIISVLPRVQEETTGAGLLQSSVITIYTMYLTWNTLSSQPDAKCNPLGEVLLEYDKISGVNGQAIFGALLMLALLAFACTVRASTSQLGKLGLYICCLVYIWTLVAPLIRSTWGHYLGLETEPVRLPSARRASAAQLRDDFKKARKILRKAENTAARAKVTQQVEKESKVRKRNLQEASKTPSKNHNDENVGASNSESRATTVEQNRSESFDRLPKVTDKSRDKDVDKLERRKDSHLASTSSTAEPSSSSPAITTVNRGGSCLPDRTSESEEHAKPLEPPPPVKIQIDHPFEKIRQDSIFINRVKEPEVSKDILRLQERILRFQAKIVKIQHKILSIQETGEVTIPRTDTKPASNQATFCLCGVCGKIKRATVTRVNYTMFLLLVTVLCFLLSFPRARKKINAIPHLCDELVSAQTCDNLAGHTGVYRVCFATAIFYFVASCVVAGVKNVGEFRSKIHNGFWYIKFLVLIALIVCSLMIPQSQLFNLVWMYFGLTGGFLFILIQLVLLVDLAHYLSETWVEKMEKASSPSISRCWYLFFLSSTGALFIISAVAMIFFYKFFVASAECRTNLFFVTFSLCQSIVAAFVSVLPKVQEAQSGT